MKSDDGERLRDAARSSEPDRFTAALLAPRDRQQDLIALAAFAGEIRRIGREVRDAMAGEIRIQWWRDAVKAGATGAKSGNPVADAFADAVRANGLSLDAIDGFLDAYAHSLYAEPPASEDAFRQELDLKEGTLFRLSAHILGDAIVTDDARHRMAEAAQAFGLMRVLLDLPYSLARGRIPIPEDAAETADEWRGPITRIAAESRSRFQHVARDYRSCSSPIKTALLPLALLEPYLRALENKARDPTRDIADIAPMTRMWRMYASYLSSRL